MFIICIDLLLTSIIAFVYIAFVVLLGKLGLIRGKAKCTIKMAGLKDVKQSDALVAAVVFIVIVLLILALPVNVNYWKGLLIAFIGSVPLIWRYHLFTAFYLLGLLLSSSLLWTGIVTFNALVIIILILGVFAELAKRRLVNRATAAVLITIPIILFTWLPGVSLSLDNILVKDAKDVELIHIETFESSTVVVYKTVFMGDELCYVVDHITRPLGVLYRSRFFSGWARSAPQMGFYIYDRLGGRRPFPFIYLVERVEGEYFIYIERIDDSIEFFIIGDFQEKIYTLSEAKEAVDYYILIKPEQKYTVVRDNQNNWTGWIYIIAFDEREELV